MKKAHILTCLLSLIGLLGYQQTACGWGAMGHMLTAQIAKDYLQPHTQQAVIQRLSATITFPHVTHTFNKTDTPPKLAYKLHGMLLASTWADAIKGYKHWPHKSVYSAFHFGNIKLTVYPFYRTQTISKQQYNQDNITSAIASCIKTLMLANSTKTQQAVALRYLIHLVGDIHQPLHVTEPQFYYQHKINNSAGGNNILFAPANLATNNSLTIPGSNQQTSPITADELHAYIDNGATSFINIPTPWIWPFHGQALWKQYHNQYLSYIQDYAKTIEHRQSSRNPAPQPQVSAIVSAARSYQLATTLLNPNKGYVKYQATSHQHWSKPAILISFPQGITKFNAIANPIIDQQIYLGGRQLAHYLNAIYTPSKADPRYIAYVNGIKQNPNILTFSQLAKHLEK